MNRSGGTSRTWNQFHSIALGTVLQNIPPPFVVQSMTAPGCSDLVLRDIMPDRGRRPNSARAEGVAICDFALHRYVGCWIRPCRDGSTPNIKVMAVVSFILSW